MAFELGIGNNPGYIIGLIVVHFLYSKYLIISIIFMSYLVALLGNSSTNSNK